MEDIKNVDTINSTRNRLRILDENLARANFRQRAVLLERAYINAMRATDEDVDYLKDLIALIEKWGRTTGQSFENHTIKLSIKLTGDVFDKMSAIANNVATRVENLTQRAADFTVEIQSVPVKGPDDNN